MIGLGSFAAFGLGYLVGSIPFGLVLTKLAGYGDIRTIGSGNIGATNVLRTGDKKLAALTLLLDSGKGALVVLACASLTSFPLLAGVGAILGHCFPVWLSFRGGKGVSTALGVLLISVPLAGLGAALAWITGLYTTRISSASALLACAAAPLCALAFYGVGPAALVLCIALLVTARHKDNIHRLLAGTEPRVSLGRAKI